MHNNMAELYLYNLYWCSQPFRKARFWDYATEKWAAMNSEEVTIESLPNLAAVAADEYLAGLPSDVKRSSASS